MSDPSEYLLKFDFTEFESEAGRASRAYTDFGESVRAVVNSVSGDLSVLQREAGGVSSSLAALTPQIDRSFQSTKIQLGATVRDMSDVARHGEKIANEMTRLSGMRLDSMIGDGGVPGQSKAGTEAVVAATTADMATETASVADAQSRATTKRMKDAGDASKKQADIVTRYVKSEIGSAKSAITGLMGHASAGVFKGGIISGLIGAMILGYKEKDRLRAEAGEVKNVFEATGESLFGGASRKATRYFANFQERAQWYFGIGRKETQGVLKMMVEAGYKSKEIMTVFNKDLGRAGDNVTMASMATDKHFNQATGTSMKNIIQINVELGDSLDVASDKYVRLAFMGQRSAMGIEKFTNAVLSGASAMQQYGVDVEDVADVMGKIQRHYEDMGLSPQYAGDQAAKITQGLGRGLASLGPGMKAILAQKMFPELNALDALQKWEDGFKRAGSGEDNDFMLQATVGLREWATSGGRGRAEAIKVMEMQGLDNRTAATLYDLGGKLKEGNSIADLTMKEQKRLADAYKTEGQRVSSLEKTQKKLRESIGYIGRGLLKILVSILGVLAVGIKTMPTLIQAAMEKDPKKAAVAIYDAGARQAKLFAHIGSGVKDIKTGAGLLGKAFGGEFGSLIEPISTAMGDDTGDAEGTDPIEELNNKLKAEIARVQAFARELEAKLGVEGASDWMREKASSAMQKGSELVEGLLPHELMGAGAQGLTMKATPQGDSTVGTNPPPPATNASGRSSKVTLSSRSLAQSRMKHSESSMNMTHTQGAMP